MNTLLEYQYRDADNYKEYRTVIISGVLEFASIQPFMEREEFFIPAEVGLENLFPEVFSEADHVWHEISTLEMTDKPPTVEISAEEMISRFRRAHENDWNTRYYFREKFPHFSTGDMLNLLSEILGERITLHGTEKLDSR